MSTNYSKFKVKCWAEVSGQEFELVQVSMEYALNSIPSATVTLALGKDARTGEDSKANSFENSLFSFRNPISIFVSYVEDSSELTQGFERLESIQPQEVFRGYITGFGYQRSASAVVLSVSVEHWLSDLAASSMISANTHNMMPSDLQVAALRGSADPNVKSNGGSILSYGFVADILKSDVGANLWTNGIKKIAEAGASSQALLEHELKFVGNCPGIQYAKNQAALDALKLMDGELRIRLVGADNVLAAIIEDLSSLFLDNYVGQSIWDCIISASANYMFAVAPQISKAVVLPFLPCIAGQPFKVITADKIYSASIAGDMPRTIRAVGIMFYEKGAILSAPNDISVDSNPGKFISGICKGTILFKQAPAWLGVGSIGGYADGDDKTNAPKAGIKSGTNPDGGTPSNKPPISSNIEQTQSLRDNYAKSVYGFEILKGRQGTITGPLRLDIGVSSYVEFEIPLNSDPNSTPAKFRGIVVKVDINIDAQSANATTTYTLAYVRRAGEEGGDLTMTEHPIYEQMAPPDLGIRLDDGIVSA